ncbi:MAG: hypothetical protein WBD02_00920 [Acidimicrobiia bacterium]
MTAYPPMPNIPSSAVPKKRAGVKIGAMLMILGVVAGGAMLLMGGNDLVSAAGGKFYEIAPSTPFPAYETGLRGIYSTDKYQTGLSLTANGQSVDVDDVASDSDSGTNFNAKVRMPSGSTIDVYQKFTFQGKNKTAYLLEGADSSSGVRNFVGPGVSGKSLAFVGGGILLGGLLFLAGLITLIVSLRRRKRDRMAMAGYGAMAAPGWSPAPGAPLPTADPSAPWNVAPGAPPAPPYPSAPPPPQAYAPPPPSVPPMAPPEGSAPISDDPGSDGWASPEPPPGS